MRRLDRLISTVLAFLWFYGDVILAALIAGSLIALGIASLFMD